MKKWKKLPAWVTWRNALGVIFLIQCVRLLPAPGPEPVRLDRIAAGLLAAACLVSAAICFSDSLVDWACRPLHWFIDKVYIGNEKLETPPVTLRLAESYLQERRWQDAIAECERQLEYHPQHEQLWQTLILAAEQSGAHEQATYYRQRSEERR